MKKLKLILFLLTWVVSSNNAIAYGPPNYLPDGAHPRIFLTPSVLSTLQAKLTANDPDWLELKARADTLVTYSVPAYNATVWPNNAIPYAYEGSSWYEAATVLGLAYQVTGNTVYAAKLKQLAIVMANAGNAPIIVDVGYPTRFAAVAMALTYDWLYDYLDSTTKTKMVDTINGWYTMFYNESNGLYIPLNGNNNYLGGHILGLGLCGLATYGDNATAPAINTLVSGWWNGPVVDAFSHEGAGGGVLESYNYGPNHISRLLEYALAIKTASGKDISSTYTAKLITNMFYNLKPNRWQSTDEGDMAGDYTGVMGMNLPILLSSIDTTTQGDKAAYFYSHMATPSISGARDAQTAEAFDRVLFKNSRNQIDYRTTEPTYYRSIGDDHLYVRSDWTDSAVWSSFAGGAGVWTDHQSRASGHIAIARGNDSLLVNVGQWKGTSGVDGTPQTMTNTSNMLNTLFTNGAASAAYGTDYVGGQGGWGSLDNVLKYESGSNYSYMKSDLSTAYAIQDGTHDDVVYFHRNYVYRGTGTFVLYDRVRMRTTGLSKEFRFHLHKQSTNTNNAGLAKSVLGSSALFIQPIYPATASISLTTANNASANPVIKLTNTAISTDFNPLTVLIADASNSAMPPTSGIDTTSMQGVLVSLTTPQVVMFSKDGTQQNSVTYTASYAGGITGHHLLVDMEQATYDVYRDGGKIITGAVASDQGVLSFSATGGGQFQIIETGQPVLSDTTAPAINTFTIPATTTSLTVPISSLSATDNTGVTGYLVTESSSIPSIGTAGWSVSAPTSFSFSSAGSRMAYAWAKDAAGNLSNGMGRPVTITLPDVTAPVVSAFTMPATATSLTVAISSFTATDSVGVTGYKVTESSAAPAAGATGWTSSAPTSFTFSSVGSKTAYAWAKDAAGNVSASTSRPVTITLPDVTAPTVSAFNMPATSTSLTVIISSFTASDSVGVTGYMVTESSPAPAVGATGWSASVPTSYTFSSAGVKTAYAWAKDAAGNVSASLSRSVTISLSDTTAPSVTAFATPTTATSLAVPITTLAASDNVGVTGYLITESSITPAPTATGWTTSVPTTYTFASSGVRTAYAWAKDAAGNVSSNRSAIVTITLTDTTAPSISAFSLPVTATTLTVPVSSLVATDAVAVTGYLISESTSVPTASAIGWSINAPTSFTFAGAGARTAYAWAKDATGNVSSSRSASISITLPDTMAPVVSAFTIPATATALSVSVSTFTATDAVSVTGYLITESSSAPAASAAGWIASAPTSFTFSAAGSRTAYAWAKDAAGNVSKSMSQAVVITLPDTTAPTVSISAPAGNATISGTLSVTASANDSVGVSRVEFYVKGALVSTVTTAPYSFNWDTSAVANGTCTLMAKAYDAAGNVGQSSTVTVTVNNPVTDTTPPITSITSPTAGATVNGTVTIATSTADNVAVTKVELYVNGSLFATDTTAPFSFSWDTTATADGTYDLTTKAFDAAGNVGQSAKVTVTVSNLAVSILNPTDGSTTSGTTTVTTTTKGKGVSKVDFYINGKLHTTKTAAKVTAASVTSAESASLSFTWDTTTFANGSYTLTAVAYDETGKAVQSTPVTAVVSNPVAVAAVKGDANVDGVVNVADALLVLKAATDPALQTGTLKTAADVAPLDAAGKPLGNGVIDISDALLTLRKAVGLLQW